MDDSVTHDVCVHLHVSRKIYLNNKNMEMKSVRFFFRNWQYNYYYERVILERNKKSN